MHFLANILLIFSNMGAFSTPRATSSGHKILLPPSPLCHRPFPPSPLPPLPPPSPHLLMLPHPSSPLPTSPHPKPRRLTLGQVQLQRSTLLKKLSPGLATQEKLKSSPTMQILIKSWSANLWARQTWRYQKAKVTKSLRKVKVVKWGNRKVTQKLLPKRSCPSTTPSEVERRWWNRKMLFQNQLICWNLSVAAGHWKNFPRRAKLRKWNQWILQQRVSSLATVWKSFQWASTPRRSWRERVEQKLNFQVCCDLAGK